MIRNVITDNNNDVTTIAISGFVAFDNNACNDTFNPRPTIAIIIKKRATWSITAKTFSGILTKVFKTARTKNPNKKYGISIFAYHQIVVNSFERSRK